MTRKKYNIFRFSLMDIFRFSVSILCVLVLVLLVLAPEFMMKLGDFISAQFSKYVK